MKVLVWEVLAIDRRGNSAGRITALTTDARDEAVLAFLNAGYNVSYSEVAEEI